MTLTPKNKSKFNRKNKNLISNQYFSKQNKQKIINIKSKN